MNSNKELLELAAKAAGMDGLGLFWNDRLKCLWDAEGLTFDPLEDDGDALRLAVKLGINIEFFIVTKRIWCFQDSDGNPSDESVFEESYGDDPYAATRRAIVRAAAEIGRGMG